VIFVTVGTQLPFDRLVSAVDEWARRRAVRPDVLAQVGAGRADYGSLRCVRSLDGARYAEAVSTARLVVAHAGIGTILTVLDRGIPAIVMARDDRRGECRNDHQIQTARQLERMGLVTVVWSEAELPALIERALEQPPGCRAARQRNTDLVDYLRSWLLDLLGR
jgi:UDP-N-acetylglucosamine transferase subunit ALG13